MSTLGDGKSPDDTTEMAETADAAESESISVLAGLGFPTLVTDTQGRITRLNDEAQALFAVDATAAVGNHPEALLDEESTVSSAAEEVITTGSEIQDREEEFVVDGKAIPVSRTVTPVFEDGECVGAVEVDRDIQARIERRERTEALEQYQVSLLEDLRATLAKLADGDLTVDPSVDPPEVDYDELQTVYEEFSGMNDDVRRVVENFGQVLTSLTDQTGAVAETSDTLSASSEEVTASIQQIDASTDEMADSAERLASDTETANQTVDDLSASIEEITATAEEIRARSEEATDLTESGVTDIRQAL
ncbi:PAS domain-containing protein [Halomicroarcula sp. GCM10025817]|uniref:methyl-accepting chemotaxis protein n=1 Tax=Haloarcula TaxID=2237 RepID=UPI0023E830F7|nr:PAS domain-containing protein [Halomicroarcula sp. SYNS111]